MSNHKAKPTDSTGRYAYDGLERVVHEKARLGIVTSLVTHPQGLLFNDLKELCALTDGNQHHVHNAKPTETKRSEANVPQEDFHAVGHAGEFLRILNEAEFFAPIGYQKHFDNISIAYARILRRARDAGATGDFSDEEFEAIVQMLMGARGYLSRRYSYAGGAVVAVPEHVISAYQRLMTRGLFNAPDKANGHDR